MLLRLLRPLHRGIRAQSQAPNVPVTRGGIQLLVGQNAVINLQMAPSTLQETVTVTGVK